MAQVSFIIIHSTGLAPFPRLSAPPHSSHSHLTKPSNFNKENKIQSQQIRILHKTNKKNFFSELLAFWKVFSLLYMYSILGRGSFCFNYCLNPAWRGGDQFVALLRWYEAQVSLTVAFSSSAFFLSLVSLFPLDNTSYILYVQAW